MPTSSQTRALALVAVVALALAACSSGGSDASSSSSRATTTARSTDGSSTTTSPTGSTGLAGSAGCGTDTKLEIGSQQEITVKSGGLERKSDVWLPKGYRSDLPAPLIIDFHAFAPRSIEEGFSGLTIKRDDGSIPADTAGTVVLTPLGIAAGTTPAWNVTHYAKWADDEGFAIDLLDQVEKTTCIDTHRVYLTGFAIGAQMAAVVACDHADRITAFAAVSGIFDPAGCKPSRAVPVLTFNGTADPMIPYKGGIGPNVPMLNLDAATSAGETDMIARLKPVPDVIDTWVQRDGCGATPDTFKAAPDATLSEWSGCKDGAVVKSYLFQGGGHAWPQSPGTKALAGLLGPTPTSLPATDLILAFFSEHKLP